jgi:uncharacterized protein affecting Mg2+/Co2+ transport
LFNEQENQVILQNLSEEAFQLVHSYYVITCNELNRFTLVKASVVCVRGPLITAETTDATKNTLNSSPAGY